MKKFKRSFIALALALVLFISPAAQTFAAEELPTEAVYDMEKGGTQTFTIRSADGEVGVVTVEELAGNSRITDGNYRVAYDNYVWQAAFKVSIKDNKIYNAYEPYNFCLFGEIKYPALTRPSVTHVIYAFIFKYNQMNYNTGIDAQIINNEMVITRR